MLSETDRSTLLVIARESITTAVHNQPLPSLNLHSLSPALNEPRATFITLNIDHELRGCIGGLYASQPLALDVQEHARSAALHDPRFPPVIPSEIPHLHIEVSVLTLPELVAHQSPEDLLEILRPNIDGVMLVSGYRRSTFLPQVWEKVPNKVQFMEMLSEKMGASPSAWRLPTTEVYRYQVEIFEEPKDN